MAFEWKEEGDLRPGQDPAWEEGLQTREKVNVEKIRAKRKRLTCQLPADQAALVRGLWTVVRGRALPGRCWKRRSGGLGGEGPVLLLPASGNILDRIGKGTSCKI